MRAADAVVEAAPAAPRAQPQSWISTEGDANECEILFFALLLAHSCKGGVAELRKWAKDVIEHESLAATELRAQWKPSGNVPNIHGPMTAAYKDHVWTKPELDTIGAAMKRWDGPGGHDSLEAPHLRTHWQMKPLGARRDKKTAGPLRWKSWQLVSVAALIGGNKSWQQLRSALQLDGMEPAAVPTSRERLAQTEEEKAALEIALAEKDAEIAAKKKELQRQTDTLRKAKARNKEKAKEKATAVRAAKEAKDAKMAKLIAEAKVRIEAKAAAAALKATTAKMMELESEKEAAEQREEREKRLKNAQAARARDAEKETEKVSRKLRRTEKQLEKNADVEMEEADDEMETDDEDPTARLPFELLPRRDEKGRWQSESPEIRSLRWAQLGRGVAPTTVEANLQDVFALLAPEVQIPAASDSHIHKMRGEVTLAGEAMAAWKFAKAKRIMCFGWDESTKFGNAVFSCNFQVQHEDGSIEDLCLRGLSIMPEGGTSRAVLEHIEKRILSHSRRLLTLWMQTFEKANGGAGSWAAAGGPSPENIGVHRLCEDTVRASRLTSPSAHIHGHLTVTSGTPHTPRLL